MTKTVAALLLALIFGLSTLLYAESPPQVAAPPPGMMPPPPLPGELPDRHTFRVSPVEQVAPGLYRVGDILIDKKERTVSFPAEVNMDKGLLEYVLVRTGGKTHESLLRTRIEPYNLQVACLLLGIEGTATPLAFQGAPETPKGDPVALSIHLPTGAPIKPEQWMVRTVDGVNRDLSDLRWVFTGSVVTSGRFAAQAEGSIIAVFHDPVAMVDNASAGGESDKIWFVKEGTVPPVGTPITLVIRAIK
ncbi:MAG: hypothetical protein GJT30_03270 [Geobacter sp.]|nr:hypothetical protein [Geobacter sp.]